MNLRRKGKKRLPRAARQVLVQPLAPNLCWSIGFMRDTLWSGRTFRTFNAVNDYNSEVLAVEVDTSLSSSRVVRVLDRNSYVERFNRIYRTDVLDLYVFSRLDEVRAATEVFVREYNEERPHESLGDMPTAEFAARRARGGVLPPPATPKTPTQTLYS